MTGLRGKSSWRPSRRTVLQGAAATAAATVVAPRVGLAAEELNILVWCDHADEKLIKPFEAANNVKVNVKTYEGTGTALSLVEQSKPGDWDVFVIDAPDVPQVAGSGLLMELPEDIAPWGDMFEEIKNSPFTRVDGKLYAAPEKFGYYGFCYNKDKIDEADAKRGDLPWNSKYKGQLAVYDYYFPIIQMVGISLGWKPNEIDETKLEEIRKRLLEAKPNVKLIGDIVSVQNALATGNADAIVGGAEYAVSGLMGSNPHLDWTISDQGGLIWTQGLAVFNDSKRKDLAQAFVKHVLSPKGQASLATSDCFWAMPTNGKAELDDATKKTLRWDQQGDFLSRSVYSQLPAGDLDAAMLDVWTEFLQS